MAADAQGRPAAPVQPGGGVLEGPASYRVGPSVLGQRPGTLRFDGERLSFVDARGRARLDAPVRECHSVHIAELDTAFDVWHAGVRHRIILDTTSPAPYVPASVAGQGVVGAVVAFEAAREGLAQYRSQKAVARAWVELLRHRVGLPPPGVRVRRPAGRFRYVVTALAAVFAVTAAIVGACWLAWAP